MHLVTAPHFSSIAAYGTQKCCISLDGWFFSIFD